MVHSLPPSHGASARTANLSRRVTGAWGVVAGVVGVCTVFAAGYVRTAPARAAYTAQPRTLGTYRDGTYQAWGSGRHGRILATVVIRRGRIASASITTCRMRYPCRMIEALPAQVVARQGTEVDIVSGATDSGEVFARAVDRALAEAARHADAQEPR
ncbi:MAG: FMN-binding protein [Vicinamibacterales bacterium]